ncbi:MAG: protein-L-isoaspartate O-methyltransferase [Candidatus Micrarchaeota archaeon]|nr:protein-L-isoaspartate O-methyltransferase [Candidatus Micrarchaeota archaeon]
MKNQEELARYLFSTGYIKTKKILDIFIKTDRKNFVLKEHKDLAYIDCPLAIGYGQTISAPHMHALVLEELELLENKKYKILEIGTGSGYLTALIKQLCLKSTIFSIEKIEQLCNFALENLKKANIKCDFFKTTNFLAKDESVYILNIDGYYGLENFAPFDRIVVGACYNSFPDFLAKQLDNYGVLITPILSHDGFQHLIKFKNNKPSSYIDLGLVSFVFMNKD